MIQSSLLLTMGIFSYDRFWGFEMGRIANCFVLSSRTKTDITEIKVNNWIPRPVIRSTTASKYSKANSNLKNLWISYGSYGMDFTITGATSKYPKKRMKEIHSRHSFRFLLEKSKCHHVNKFSFTCFLGPLKLPPVYFSGRMKSPCNPAGAQFLSFSLRYCFI